MSSSPRADEENQLSPVNDAPTNNGVVGDSEDAQNAGNSTTAGDEVLDELIKAALPELVTKDSAGNAVVNLATLQRMVLFQLQINILDKITPLANRRLEGKNPLRDEELKKHLTDYAQGVRNWELMVDHQQRAASSTTGDPFHISTKWPLTKMVLEERGLDSLAPALLSYSKGTLEKFIGTFDQRTRINKQRTLGALGQRFAMAMFGGIFLIGPMLLMVYRNDLNTSTVTTSVAVVIFAAAMAFYTSATPEAVVGAVAAYAAVLVVFVGTLQQGQTSQ